MPVSIKKCDCESEFQDLTYGKQNRVFNVDEKGKGKCTVCGKKS
jgi:hypothetical protein